MADVLAIGSSKDPGGAMENFTANIAGSMISPGIVRETVRAYDKKVYETPTFVQKIFRNTPIIGPSLNKPAINKYAEVVNRNDWPLAGRFVGVVAPEHPVLKVAADRGLDVPTFDRSLQMGGERMDYDTAYRFRQIAGEILDRLDRQSLNAISTLPEDQAEALMVKNRDIASRMARNQIKTEKIKESLTNPDRTQ
jgi:hypothetical protein